MTAVLQQRGPLDADTHKENVVWDGGGDEVMQRKPKNSRLVSKVLEARAEAWNRVPHGLGRKLPC